MEKSYIIGKAMGTSGITMPNGGTTGQVLTKLSDVDQDVGWENVPDNGITQSEVIERNSTLNATTNSADFAEKSADGSSGLYYKKKQFVQNQLSTVYTNIFTQADAEWFSYASAQYINGYIYIFGSLEGSAIKVNIENSTKEYITLSGVQDVTNYYLYNGSVQLDGKIYMIYRVSGANVLYRFDPQTNNMEPVHSYSSQLGGCKLFIYNGRIGHLTTGIAPNIVWYDPSTESSESVSLTNSNPGIDGGTGVVVSNNTLICINVKTNTTSTWTVNLETYEVQYQGDQTVTKMPTFYTMGNDPIIFMNNNIIYFLGGISPAMSFIKGMYAYDPNTLSYKYINTNQGSGSVCCISTQESSQVLYICGGYASGTTQSSNIQSFLFYGYDYSYTQLAALSDLPSVGWSIYSAGSAADATLSSSSKIYYVMLFSEEELCVFEGTITGMLIGSIPTCFAETKGFNVNDISYTYKDIAAFLTPEGKIKVYQNTSGEYTDLTSNFYAYIFYQNLAD